MDEREENGKEERGKTEDSKVKKIKRKIGVRDK